MSGEQDNGPFEQQRAQMLADIETDVKYTRQMTGRERLDERVMAAMREVRREDFVPDDQRQASFHDGALPVGYGQTISQPFIVALMTDLLEADENSVVLEIGTGTGYQAAILSRLVRKVYSIERIPELARSARLRLENLGYDNVETRCGDGYRGWPDEAPFDAIIVTAAAPSVPAALVDQLKTGGRLVIPIGAPRRHQDLVVITRGRNGEVETTNILGVAFVPMVEDSGPDD